jgi:hypothetical protein
MRHNQNNRLLLVICVWLAAVPAVPAQTWTLTSAPITNWQSVASSADGTKLVAAAGGYVGSAGRAPIFLSTNAGISWTQSSAPVTNWLHVASSADGSRLVAVGEQIYYSTNSGDTWMQSSGSPQPNEFWSSVASSADGTKSVVGQLGGTIPQPHGIFLSTDSGSTWHPAGVNGSAVASSADGNKLLAVEYNASPAFISSSTNAGRTWQSNNLAAARFWWGVASAAEGVKLAAEAGQMQYPFGSTGAVYTSTDSGAAWRSNNAPVINWSCIASSADGTRLVAAANGGGIYTSMDSGTTWLTNNAPATNWISVASSADGNRLVALVYGGGIYTASVAPSPSLSLTRSGDNLALSWSIPSTPLVVQENSDMSGTNWVAVTNTPTFDLTNLQNQVILSPSNGSGFYRLASP